MEKLKLKLNKKQLVLALFIAGAVLILFDIIMLAVVVPQGRPGFFKIMLALIFGAMTLLGVWLLLAAYVHSHDADSHFFRYDEETRRNIPTKELTGERVIRRMSLYLRNMVGKDDYLPEVGSGTTSGKRTKSSGKTGYWRRWSPTRCCMIWRVSIGMTAGSSSFGRTPRLFTTSRTN